MTNDPNAKPYPYDYVRDVMTERAEQEIRKQDVQFLDWLLQTRVDDIDKTLARLVNMILHGGKAGMVDAFQLCDGIEQEYIAHRMESPETDEIVEAA